MNANKSQTRVLVTALLFCVAWLGAACGANSVQSRSDSQASGETNGVVLRGLAYTPPTIEVDAGTEVTWVNQDDGVDHTVTSGQQKEQGVPGVTKDNKAQPDGTFDRALPDRGDAFSFTFDEPGTYAYYCEIHAAMTAEVIVR
ncbi:MAG: cupredoxin domain-containing protein [Actinomycetota bacterium]